MRRFLRYMVVGVSTFLLDLFLLWFMTSVVGIPYYVSIPLAFFVGVSLNYFISRRHVFKGSKRPWHTGYVYSILAACTGAVIITTLVSLLVEYFSIQYLVARTAVAGVVGIGNYMFNLYVNFNVAGKEY